MDQTIKLTSRPKGTDQEILENLKCPGCNRNQLRWKNTGGRVGHEVIRSTCGSCGDDVEVIVPGNPLMGFFGR